MSGTAELMDQAIRRACNALSHRQKDDGHWVFELEADATIPAEFILLEHFIGEIDQELSKKIAVYLRRMQGEHGGWPLYYDGGFDMSCSVKVYFALKAVGDDPAAPHMIRARQSILDHGGAERSNVFTRIQLALYNQVPWCAVPAMPIEIMWLPKTAPFSIWHISYWSRTVVVPLLVLASLRPQAVNPHHISVQELFLQKPENIRDWIRGPNKSGWGKFFKGLDVLLQPIHANVPEFIRRASIRKAVEFVESRRNGLAGLGAIYPAMANAVMMYHALGYSRNDKRYAEAWEAVKRLLIVRQNEAYCQPCKSPVWDTGLSAHAIIETRSALKKETTSDVNDQTLLKAAAWLRQKQILSRKGDWAVQTPSLMSGGWAFQYENDFYPDVDDTAVVAMFLHRMNDTENTHAIERARKWIKGMQSSNGGWGAFDIDNNKNLLNHIPFADHGALLDPSTADVTARCVSFLAQLGYAQDHENIEKGTTYLRSEQEPDGSWFGRWGTNYIYGTWSVLCALNAAKIPLTDDAIRKATAWLVSVQRDDGSWGEDEASYEGAPPGCYKLGLPSQTAWALLGLMAAGERNHPAVTKGINWLVSSQDKNGEWQEKPFNAVGFPRVFYLHYHGYKFFFPLLALSRYRNLVTGNMVTVNYGF